MKQEECHAAGFHHFYDFNIELEAWEWLDARADELGTNPKALAEDILGSLPIIETSLSRRVVTAARNLSLERGRQAAAAMGRLLRRRH